MSVDDVRGKRQTADLFTTGSSSATPTLQLTTRLSNRSWLGDDEDDDDPFAEIDGELADQADLESNLARDKHARNAAEVTKLVDALQDASIGEEELIETCYQLVSVARPGTCHALTLRAACRSCT